LRRLLHLSCDLSIQALQRGQSFDGFGHQIMANVNKSRWNRSVFGV